MNLGIAFQLADDLLDFTSTDDALGKAAGADLLEGKITLPLILLLNSEPSLRETLESIMFDGNYGERSREFLKGKLDEHKTLDKIRLIALSYAEKARKNLEVLPETEYRSALDEIPNFVIGRNS
jgi:geranylgeranyl pyrophosphate synthase